MLKCCVTKDPKLPHSLHIFTDASQVAYGVVGYVVSRGMNITSKCLCSKSKNNIIELSGNYFSFKSVHLWADAQVPLSWVTSKEAYFYYVKNQLREAQKLIDKIKSSIQKFCSEVNPADYIILVEESGKLGNLRKADTDSIIIQVFHNKI